MRVSIGSPDRIRWMSSLAAAAGLTLALLAALHAVPARLGSFVSASNSAPGLAAGAQLPAPIGSSAPLDPRIAGLAARRPGLGIEAIVQFKSNVTLQRAQRDVSRVSGRVIGNLHIINALAVKVTAGRARWLAANPDVHAVSLNTAVRTQSAPGHDGLDRKPGSGHNRQSNPSSGSTGLQTTYDQTLNLYPVLTQGDVGTGVGVAVIDTGVDGNLPDFQGMPGSGSRVVETAVTNPNATSALDGYGHGTDVAGIIAGNGFARPVDDPLHGQYLGVAPLANLISIKASDDQGNATVLNVIYGLQFAIDHQSDYNIRVVNLSLDSQTPQSYVTDPLDAAAEAAWMHGIVVVAAAGNRGTDPDAVQYAPGNDPYVITVGAVDENGTANPSDDYLANWSSRGTTQDGFHKPDVNAPGAHIVSVLAPGSVFASACPACQVSGGAYIRTSGTSMAAPMISGLVADVLQAHPDWTPDQVKGALTSPSVDSNPALQELDAAKVVALQSPPSADGGLAPNQFIDPATGSIDYSRSSWSRSSWSTATGSLSAGFARSSWSCNCAATVSAAPSDDSGNVDSSRSTWSRSTWSVHFDPNSPNG